MGQEDRQRDDLRHVAETHRQSKINEQDLRKFMIACRKDAKIAKIYEFYSHEILFAFFVPFAAGAHMSFYPEKSC
jgi:hypothetical protein